MSCQVVSILSKFLKFIWYPLKLQYTAPVHNFIVSTSTQPQCAHSQVLLGLLKLPPAPPCLWPPVLSSHWRLRGFYRTKHNMSMTCIKPSSDFSVPSKLLRKKLKTRLLKNTLKPCMRKSVGIAFPHPQLYSGLTPFTALENIYPFFRSAMLSLKTSLQGVSHAWALPSAASLLSG